MKPSTPLALGNWQKVTLAALMCTSAASANASLTGDKIDWQYYAFGSDYNYAGSPGSFVAGYTTDQFVDYFTIGGNGTQIVFDYSTYVPTGGPMQWSDSEQSYSANGLTIDNGLLLFNFDSPITSVTVNSQTNMLGFSNANISYNAAAIAIDWELLDFTASTLVVLDINNPQTVPVPAAAWLFGTAVLGLVALRRS